MMSAPPDPRLVRKPFFESPASPLTAGNGNGNGNGKRKSNASPEQRPRKLARTDNLRGASPTPTSSPGGGSPVNTPTQLQVQPNSLASHTPSRIYASLERLTKEIGSVTQKSIAKSEAKSLWHEAQSAKASSRGYEDRWGDNSDFHSDDKAKQSVRDCQRLLHDAEIKKQEALTEFITALSDHQQPKHTTDDIGHVTLEEFKATVDALRADIKAAQAGQSELPSLRRELEDAKQELQKVRAIEDELSIVRNNTEEYGKPSVNSRFKRLDHLVNNLTNQVGGDDARVPLIQRVVDVEKDKHLVEKNLDSMKSVKMDINTLVQRVDNIQQLRGNNMFLKQETNNLASRLANTQQRIAPLEPLPEKLDTLTQRVDQTQTVTKSIEESLKAKVVAVNKLNNDIKALKIASDASGQGKDVAIDRQLALSTGRGTAEDDESNNRRLQKLEGLFADFNFEAQEKEKMVEEHIDSLLQEVKDDIARLSSEFRTAIEELRQQRSPQPTQPRKLNGFTLAEGTSSNSDGRPNSLPTRTPNGATPLESDQTKAPNLSSELHLDNLTSKLDALTRHVHHLQRLHDNLTTNDIHQAMLDQISEQYPHLKNYQSTCEALAQSVEQVKAGLEEVVGQSVEQVKAGLEEVTGRVRAAEEGSKEACAGLRELRAAVEQHASGRLEVESKVEEVESKVEGLEQWGHECDSRVGSLEQGVEQARGRVDKHDADLETVMNLYEVVVENVKEEVGRLRGRIDQTAAATTTRDEAEVSSTTTDEERGRLLQSFQRGRGRGVGSVGAALKCRGRGGGLRRG
ncbi:hypothetical protein MBLNU230_g8613t1 [Neophaeotheca triangularis]